MNGVGSLSGYVYGASIMSMCFVVIGLAWIAVAGRINLRYYANETQPYFMQHVGGLSALLLWLGFALALTRLAANSFSPFLYFQF